MQGLSFFDKEMGQKRNCGIISFHSQEHSMIKRYLWLQDSLYSCGFSWNVKTQVVGLGWEFSEDRTEILAPNFKKDFCVLAAKHLRLFLQGKVKWPLGSDLSFPSSVYGVAWN